MPEVRQLSFSTVTGYSGASAMDRGIKNSIWLSLVPAAWQPGLQTIPGKPTETPGTNVDGTGPAPRGAGPGTNPSGDVASNGETAAPGGEGNALRGSTPRKTEGCSTSRSGGGGGLASVGLAIASVLIALRRSRRGHR
jgi:hypothetical protein